MEKEQIEKVRRGLNYLANYPTKDLWRLFVDGRLHESEGGWVSYEEREPGCLRSAFNALALTLTNIENPVISTKMIKGIHAMALSHDKRESFPGNYRNWYAPFAFNKDRVSVEGILDFINRVENESFYSGYGSFLGPRNTSPDESDENVVNTKESITWGNIDYLLNQYGCKTKQELAEKLYDPIASGQYVYQNPHWELIEWKMNSLTDELNQTLSGKHDGDDDKTIAAIVHFIKEYELLHPFPDGNGRVFVNLLLNRLLMQAGLPPVTFYEPNQFDLKSEIQIVDIVKEGIQNTMAIIDGKADIFGFNSKNVPEEKGDEYNEYVSILEEKIQLERKRINDLPEVLQSPKHGAVRFFSDSPSSDTKISSNSEVEQPKSGC